LGGEKTGGNLTDRAKLDSKRHILTAARGAPLAVVVSAANAHDKTCALAVLDTLALERPRRVYRVHIRARDKNVREVPADKRHPARRWVVERTLSWTNDFRALRTRWAKKAANWLALIHFACALVLWRMSAA
jgi:transposase